MPLEKHERPAGGSPPPIGFLVGLVGATAVLAAALIVLYLESIPLPLRLMLAAVELLVSGLACWAILKMRRR